jgi:hypothetical protein
VDSCTAEHVVGQLVSLRSEVVCFYIETLHASSCALQFCAAEQAGETAWMPL